MFGPGKKEKQDWAGQKMINEGRKHGRPGGR